MCVQQLFKVKWIYEDDAAGIYNTGTFVSLLLLL